MEKGVASKLISNAGDESCTKRLTSINLISIDLIYFNMIAYRPEPSGRSWLVKIISEIIENTLCSHYIHDIIDFNQTDQEVRGVSLNMDAKFYEFLL